MHGEFKRPPRVFVATEQEAYEIDLVHSDATTLDGDVVHMWRLPMPISDVHGDDAPDEMAKRLGWVPQHTMPDQVLVPIASVRHARKKTWERSVKPAVIITVVVLAVGFGVGFYLGSQFPG